MRKLKELAKAVIVEGVKAVLLAAAGRTIMNWMNQGAAKAVA